MIIPSRENILPSCQTVKTQDRTALQPADPVTLTLWVKYLRYALTLPLRAWIRFIRILSLANLTFSS